MIKRAENVCQLFLYILHFSPRFITRLQQQLSLYITACFPACPPVQSTILSPFLHVMPACSLLMYSYTETIYHNCTHTNQLPNTFYTTTLHDIYVSETTQLQFGRQKIDCQTRVGSTKLSYTKTGISIWRQLQ